MLSFCELRTYKEQENLFSINEKPRYFYFLMKGQISVYLNEQGKTKFSKSVHQKEFFGFMDPNSQEMRRDQAIANQN